MIYSLNLLYLYSYEYFLDHEEKKVWLLVFNSLLLRHKSYYSRYYPLKNMLLGRVNDVMLLWGLPLTSDLSLPACRKKKDLLLVRAFPPKNSSGHRVGI